MLKASNNLIKDLKKQKRENEFLLFLDNFKIIKDALEGGLKPKYIFLEDEKDNIFSDYGCHVSFKYLCMISEQFKKIVIRTRSKHLHSRLAPKEWQRDNKRLPAP